MEMVVLILAAVAALVLIERQKESMSRILRARTRADAKLRRGSRR